MVKFIKPMGFYTSGKSHPNASAPPSLAPTKKSCGYPP